MGTNEKTALLRMLIVPLQYLQQIKKAKALGVGGKVLAAGEVCGGRALGRNARDSLGKDTDRGNHSQLLPPGSTSKTVPRNREKKEKKN